MPLVTLTCSSKCYPPDDRWANRLHYQQELTLHLAEDLPGILVAHGSALLLEPSTTAAAVQVDIRKFHARAVNSVDLWIHIWFTEGDLSDTWRRRARETIVSALTDWFTQQEPTITGLSWALDLFYGPGNGCIVRSDGTIECTW